ncbi:SusC/RagA family TonB-linked outer membrane protein [Dawidia soli]|uniref:TonB-dependent receptor n=1 Tax=Dawidia soli TaxID=2782352 RepID=A0AAP2DH49_9BACT|nr:TonB-dependent receptor [Dawidia soli]MBT1689277.1 TonB-dependent receptor [Dawidia soli]
MNGFYSKLGLLAALWLLVSLPGVGQTLTVKGVVRDESGETMPGVNVVIKGTTEGTTTDADGAFTIAVPDENSVLVFSFVGYKVLEEAVGTRRSLSIVIEPDISSLTEVVVVAYGEKQRKEAVVGSVTTVQPTELKIPASNLTTAMAGQIAGVIAYQRSGQPGQDNATFFIRGVTTFGYRQNPLILIDNVELTPSDLARLQVDDIASFSILKDASATALYGARGANGVILVTTKQGKEGTAKINFRLENSFSQSAQTLELADPITYMNLYNEGLTTRDPKQAPEFDHNKIINTQATLAGAPGSNPYVYPAVDWLGLLFKKRTSTQRANLSVSGGGGVARYYIGTSYNVDHGILQTDTRNNADNNIKFQNYQLRSNINIDVTKTTELIVRLSGTFNEYNGPLSADGSFSTDLYNYAVHTSPVLFPAYYEPDEANLNTKHILFGNVSRLGTNNSIDYNNPYASMLRGHKNSSQSRMSAQLEVNQDFDFITEGLSFRGMFSTNRYSYFDSQMAYSPFYYNIATYDKSSGDYSLVWLNPNPTGYNVATEYLSYSPGRPDLSTYIYFQGALDYSKALGDHTVSGTLIGTRQQILNSNAIDPKTKEASLQYSLPYRNLTLAGRATYSYKSRYFAEFNFGYNGSERFSSNHRFGFFPTIGAGWVISGEEFYKGAADVVNYLKLRTSYGLVGNDAIGNQRFFYLSDVNLNGGGNYATFGLTNNYTRDGVFIRNYENPNVTWETSRQINVALEATFFQNLSLVAEVYNQYRYNILMSRADIPSTMGLEVLNDAWPSANIGAARSRGLDLSLDYKKTFAGNGFLSARANLTYARNKYVKYEEPEYKEAYRYRSGQPINREYGYIAERLFVDDKEAANSPAQIFGLAPKGGDIKYRDLNNDGVIDGADMTFIGFPTTPEVVYGFGFSAGYGNFDLSAFFQGQARVSFFVDPERTSPFIPSPDPYIAGSTQLLKAWADSHWSEENQDLYALYPRLGITKPEIANNLQRSTWWMRDGSFMRLKSVEVGYTLPRAFVTRYKVSNCRIYFSGLNLVTFSKFKMWDPEQAGQGFNYPIQKVYNLGININI